MYRSDNVPKTLHVSWGWLEVEGEHNRVKLCVCVALYDKNKRFRENMKVDKTSTSAVFYLLIL